MNTRHRLPCPPVATRRALTLPELVISTAISSLVILVLISTNVLGLKLLARSQARMDAAFEARAVLGRLHDEIRTAKMVRVGTGSASSFVPPAAGQPLAGNALEMYASTNTAGFVRYFLDTNDASLKRWINGSSSPAVLASHVTNSPVFRVENHAGVVLTTDQNNRVVRVALEFDSLVNPAARIGAGGAFDSYRLETRVTRRTLE
jgi:hypothetical protein